ncbi:PE-PPE domain-containing protein [Mycobacterium sp. BK086]|uniref:PE-PPE domain-containing protein n=1 Tax=Mycobacterium sp. BK086 TaxID=2512165 RepID=UPI00105E5F95|nr:PE-PPE domain-containing protein [Mycobacterium sp. BK086]TDO10325.1 PE-PPE domain-containing protein [Mycobacterium sp. BK086]
MVAAALMGRIRRGSKAGGRKAALVGASAATAVAMTMGTVAPPVAPSANAALTLDTTTTGPLLWLADQLGFKSYTFDNVPVVGSITLAFDYNRADPVGLYNDLNAATFGGFNPINASFTRPNILATSPTGPLMVASGTGVPAALAAYQAMLASANGNTPAGYTPLTPSGKVNIFTGSSCTTGPTCAQGYNVTYLPIALVRNPETPNGGLYSRFAPVFNLFGMNPVSPNAQSGGSVGIKFSSGFVNVALGYDMLSDFPETLNPFALANSFMASVLPTYLLGGAELKGADLPTIEGNLIALLTLGVPSTSYSTLVSTDLPLLEPLRLPSRILNEVFKAAKIPITLGTPLADALQPALSILVNIGYTDVQTPSEGGTYNRTYDQSGQYVPFLSQATLTPQEWAAVPRDVVKALFTGFRDVLTGKPMQSPNTPDPVTPVEPEPAAALSTTPVASAATTSPTAKSAKPSKKLSSTTSKKSSAPKASAKKGVGGSKRAAS